MSREFDADNECEITTVDHYSSYERIATIYNEVYGNEQGIVSQPYSRDRYDAHSSHFLARKSGEYAGYLRVIRPSENGFPALELATISKRIDLSKCVEFSRLMVRNPYRKTCVAFGLMINGLEWTVKNGCDKILIDIFVDCERSTYSMFKSIGFEECSDPYDDTRFINSRCMLMCLDISGGQRTSHSHSEGRKARLIDRYLRRTDGSTIDSSRSLHENIGSWR
jgi:predicted GNAT family N-acyltransferase